MDESVAPVFKLLKLDFNSLVWNKSKCTVLGLKIVFLPNYPTFELIKKGAIYFLLLHLGPALRKACHKIFDDETVCLARAAKIVRREILSLKLIII